MRWRFDSRFAVYSHGIHLKRAPSEYIGTNILITTSGVCSAPALLGAIGEMGPQAVMFYELHVGACKANPRITLRTGCAVTPKVLASSSLLT